MLYCRLKDIDACLQTENSKVEEVKYVKLQVLYDETIA